MAILSEKFDRTERRVMATCLAGILFLSYCLLTDKTFFYHSLSAINRGADLLAAVEKIENDVKYSPSHLPVWEGSYVEQNLYRRDKIFTEEQSEAEIRFLEGTAVYIEENSLVIIDQVEDAPSVNLLKGTIRTKLGNSNSSIRIFNNGELINAVGNGADVSINVDDGNESVTALNGQVLLETVDGLITLNAGDRYDQRDSVIATEDVTREGDGSYQLTWNNPDEEQMQLIISRSANLSDPIIDQQTTESGYLFSPPNGGRYYWQIQNSDGSRSSGVADFKTTASLTSRATQQSNGSFRLAWSNPNREEMQLLISRSANLNNPVVNEQTTESEYIFAPRQGGRYFWRAQNADGSLSTGVQSFTAKGNTTIPTRLAQENVDGSFRLVWSNPNQEQMQLRISKQQNLKNPVIDQRTTESEYTFVPRNGGRYYWQVQNADGSRSSGVASFDVRDNFKIATQVAQQRSDGSFQLTWSNPNREQMRLTISRQANLSKPVVSEETRAAEYLFTPPQGGRYYWQVQNADGSRSSGVASFTASETDKPEQLITRSYQDMENGKSVQKTEFSWIDRSQASKGIDNQDSIARGRENPDGSIDGYNDNNGYLTQVSQQRGFQGRDVIEQVSSSNRVSINDLPAGTYFWRVRKNQDGSSWSDTRSFTIKSDQSQLLASPQDLRTLKKSDYKGVAQPASATTSWRKIAGVENYEIEVSKSPNFVGPPVSFKSAVGNKSEINKLEAGTYYWRVRTAPNGAKGSKGAWSQVKSFAVIDSAAIEKQRLIAEAKKAPNSLRSEMASPLVKDNETTSAQLGWQKQNSDELAGKLGGEISYEVQLAKNSNYDNAQSFNLAKGEKLLAANNLSSGSYFWRVRTILPDGTKGDWSSTQQFVIRKENTSQNLAVIGKQNQGTPQASETLPLPDEGVKKAVKPKKIKIKSAKLTLASPQILYPQNKKVLDVGRQKLEWEKIKGSKGYELQVYNYRNPKRPIVTTKPQDNAIKDLNLKPGKYFWRVASVSSDGIKSYSKKKTFIVKDIGAMKSLAALKPDPNDRLTTSQIAKVVDFLWLEDKRAAYYKIEASLSPEFLTTFFSQNVNSPEASFNFPQGTFYWRVISYNDKDKVIKKGKLNTFSVAATMGIPKFYGEKFESFSISRTQQTADVEFTWSVVPQADRYDLEIATDADFTEVQFSSSRIETNLSLTLEYGNYFARVRAVDSYGFGSDWSNSREIEVIGSDLKPGPGLRLPKDGAKFVYRNEPTPISFKWKARGKARDFDFQVSKDKSFRNFEISEKVEKRMIIQNLSEGEYFWRVRTYDEDGFATNWSDARTIIVAKEESPVALTFPIESNEVVKFGAKDVNLSFKWQAPKDISKFTVVVAKDENFTEIISSKVVKGKNIAALELDHSGETYWMVEGENIKEKFKVRSATGKFSIVSPADKRWDKKAKVSIGVRPSQSKYNSENGNSDASMVAGVIGIKFWMTEILGLRINLGMGEEVVKVEDSEEVSFENQQFALHVMLRDNVLSDSAFNFDLTGSMGARTMPIPIVAADAVSGYTVSTENFRFLSFGLGAERILSENWMIELESFYQTALADTENLANASNLAFLLRLQQKLLTNWQLGYGYQYETLDYVDISQTEEQNINKTSSAFEFSVGKGF